MCLGVQAPPGRAGPSRRHLDITIAVDLPVQGTKNLADYYTVTQDGDTVRFLARREVYLFDLVGI